MWLDKEAMPRLQAKHFKGAAALFKVRTGTGVDGAHSKVPFDSADEWCEQIVAFLEKVEMAGVWRTRSSTKLFILIPNNV